MERFSAIQAARIIGMPFQTLDEWDRHGFVRPSFAARGRGPGHGRGYTLPDLERLFVARELREHGLPMGEIAGLIDRIAAALGRSGEVWVAIPCEHGGGRSRAQLSTTSARALATLRKMRVTGWVIYYNRTDLDDAVQRERQAA